MIDKKEALEKFLNNISICKKYLSKLKKSDDDSYNNEVKTLNINVDIELNEYFSNLLKYNKDKISIIDFLEKISKTVDSLYKSLSEDNFDENANTFNEIITQLLDVFNNIKKNSSVYSYLFKTNNKEFQKKIKIQICDHVQKGSHGTIIDEITVLNEALSILLSISKDRIENTCTVRELTKEVMNDLESYISSISSSICHKKYEINAKEKSLIIVARNKTFYYCSRGMMFDCDPLDKQFQDYQDKLKTLIDNCTQEKIKLNINKDDYKSISTNKLKELQKNYNRENGYYDTSDKSLLITIDKPINVKKYISELITKNKQRLRLGDQLKIEDNYKDAIDKFV